MHLNHGIFQRQNEQHASFVRRLSASLNIPFYSKKIDVRSLAKKYKRSLEETGRLERYRFFEQVAEKMTRQTSGSVRSIKIVTAHTRDDQTETVLMRIIRGSGLRGLTGIPYHRKQGNFQVIRPLLSCSKNDLSVFLKENHIQACTDKSNEAAIYTRNLVRNQLLPTLIKKFNPNIQENLSSLQAVCSETQAFLDQVTAKALKSCLSRGGMGKVIALKIPRLKHLHPAIQREVLLKTLEMAKGDMKQLGFSHIQAICDLINSNQKILSLHLPNTLRIKKVEPFLFFHSMSIDRVLK